LPYWAHIGPIRALWSYLHRIYVNPGRGRWPTVFHSAAQISPHKPFAQALGAKALVQLEPCDGEVRHACAAALFSTVHPCATPWDRPSKPQIGDRATHATRPCPILPLQRTHLIPAINVGGAALLAAERSGLSIPAHAFRLPCWPAVWTPRHATEQAE
jgi:hypothetical protein